MFIWRGWSGGVAILLAILGFAAGASLAQSLGGGNRLTPLCMGIGGLIGGIGGFVAGYYANVIQPPKRIANYEVARRVELDGFVRNGTFSLGPGHAAPRSMEEAQTQADALLQAEVAVLRQKRANQHVWFIPTQYVGGIAAVAGLVLIIVGLTGRG